MSLFSGKRITVEIYGESHAEKIGVKVTGFPDFKIDFGALSAFTERRKAAGDLFSTARKEPDIPIFYGLDGDRVSGGKFTAEIVNTDVKSKDYSALYGRPRPSHADYAWHLKDGALDFSGGGRFSARLTAPLCVAGGVAKQYLEKKGVRVESYVSSVGNAFGRSYKDGVLSIDEITALRQGFPSLDKKEEMLAEIRNAKADGDSVGGTVECVVTGLSGAGDNLFGGLEGKISALVFAVPAVKGVEFGDGFALSRMRGSAANDGLYYKDGKVAFYSDRAGGINGGIANGAPITLRVAFRPTPSISKPQKTVDLVKKENAEIVINGRHDACVVPRALPVVESAVALAILDEIL